MPKSSEAFILNETAESILSEFCDWLKGVATKMIDDCKGQKEQIETLVIDLCYAINKPYEKYKNFAEQMEKTGAYESKLRLISIVCSGGSDDSTGFYQAKDEESLITVEERPTNFIKWKPFIDCANVTLGEEDRGDPKKLIQLRTQATNYLKTGLDNFFSKELKAKVGDMNITEFYSQAKGLTPTEESITPPNATTSSPEATAVVGSINVASASQQS